MLRFLAGVCAAQGLQVGHTKSGGRRRHGDLRRGLRQVFGRDPRRGLLRQPPVALGQQQGLRRRGLRDAPQKHPASLPQPEPQTSKLLPEQAGEPFEGALVPLALVSRQRASGFWVVLCRAQSRGHARREIGVEHVQVGVAVDVEGAFVAVQGATDATIRGIRLRTQNFCETIPVIRLSQAPP